MKIEFDRTETYNIDGTQAGRREASKGDVRDLPKNVALTLVDIGAAHPVSHMPSQQKADVKFDFVDLPASDKLSGAGFDSLLKVQQASDEDLLAVNGIGPKTLEDIRGCFE